MVLRSDVFRTPGFCRGINATESERGRDFTEELDNTFPGYTKKELQHFQEAVPTQTVETCSRREGQLT